MWLWVLFARVVSWLRPRRAPRPLSELEQMTRPLTEDEWRRTDEPRESYYERRERERGYHIDRGERW